MKAIQVIAILMLSNLLKAQVPCDTQYININTGWNIISSYIIPDDPDMIDVFSDIASDILIVKDQNGQVYIPWFAINDIGNWQIEQGYMVKASNNTLLTMRCTKADPATTPIVIPSGWSIISYLRATPMDPINVLNNIDNLYSCCPTIFEITGHGYLPCFGIKTMGDMLPGRGYKILTYCSDTLYYPP